MKNRIITTLISSLIIVTITAGCGSTKEIQEVGSSAVTPTVSVRTGQEVPDATEPELTDFIEEDAYDAAVFEEAPYAAAFSKMTSAGLQNEGVYAEPDWNTEEYSYEEENPFRSAKTAPFSTFAADVDTASYANVRRMILDGNAVTPDAVRAEEMINYFHYEYAEPTGEEPFGVTTELAPCPWNEDAELLLIGLQAEKLRTEELPTSNLVFLIDVSGSMSDSNKLPLVKRSFLTLVENLSEEDRVTLITYADGEEVLCEGAKGSDKAAIMSLIESLEAGGATDGQHALEMAYEAAEKNFVEGGNNRIILATDGDFNVGITSEGDLTRFIKEKTAGGLYLSVLGYGMGNYKDNKMEAIADNGNGNYYYIDDIAEARKVLVEEAGGTLFTVAKDVKLQVEFNPAMVKGYRLIGYENRTMAAEEFSDDTKDGGELGAGHQVTALYEIIPAGSDYPVPEVESRYSSYESAETSANEKEIRVAGGNEHISQAAESITHTTVDTANTGFDRETPITTDTRGDTSVDIDEGIVTAAESIPEEELPDEWLTVKIRYKQPDEDTSTLLEYPVDNTAVRDGMSDNMSWAAGVAQTTMLLKDSAYAGTSTYEQIKTRLKNIADDDYKEEFLYLLTRLGR